MPGLGYKSHGDGWRFTPGKDWRNGTLRLVEVGHTEPRDVASARIVHAWLHSQLQAQNKGQELSLGRASHALETATIAPLAFGGR